MMAKTDCTHHVERTNETEWIFNFCLGETFLIRIYELNFCQSILIVDTFDILELAVFVSPSVLRIISSHFFRAIQTPDPAFLPGLIIGNMNVKND